MPTRILLEGRPGSGKTTAIRRLAALLRTREAVGFTTEEIRDGGTRVGFALETLTGRRGVLAHVGLPGPPQVGRYGVDLGVMERLALPSFTTPAGPGTLVLIDELGRMELAYPRSGMPSGPSSGPMWTWSPPCMPSTALSPTSSSAASTSN